MAKRVFRINEPGQVKVEVTLTSPDGTFSTSCLYFEEVRMMKAPREGRRNEPKSQNFSETTEAEVILQTEHWLKNKFGKEYNLAAYEAKSKSQFTSIECLYERNWHICARRVTRYTQSLGTAYERLAAGQGIMGESAHNDSQGTFRSSAAPRPFAQC